MTERNPRSLIRGLLRVSGVKRLSMNAFDLAHSIIENYIDVCVKRVSSSSRVTKITGAMVKAKIPQVCGISHNVPSRIYVANT